MKINCTVIQSNDASSAVGINEDTELSSVWGCNEWNPLSPKTKRFTLEAHNRCWQFASIVHFSKWILSALPLPWSLNSTHVDGDKKPTETCFFLHALPPFIPPLSHSYKGWDHYKCHTDRCKLSITLLGLRFEGFAATQFTALLNRGWARQAPQLVQVTGMKEKIWRGTLYPNNALRTGVTGLYTFK